MIYFQVFGYLTRQHLEELNQWENVVPSIQIGSMSFNSIKQTDFITQYEKNLHFEEMKKTKKKQKNILKKKVNFCDTSCMNYCDTRALFLTPLKTRIEKDQKKIDFKTMCKVV